MPSSQPTAHRGETLTAPLLPLGWRVRATVASMVLAPLVNVLSFSRLTAWMGTPAPPPPEPVDASALAEFVSRIMGRLRGPWRLTCLRRSLVLYYLLRRAGQPVGLVIGVRRGEGRDFEAHAWLTCRGQPYLEDSDSHMPEFKVIAKFPAGRDSGPLP